MNFRFLLLLVLCSGWVAGTLAQTNINGTVNHYAAITAPANLQNQQTITLDNATGFAIGDRVLIIQMQGATMNTSNTASYGDLTGIGNAGNYEFSQIINVLGNDVTLANCISRSYDVAGKVQLVKVPVYDNCTVNGTLTASPWNGSTGGVLVIEVNATLTLNADIDVTGLGFRGGITSDSDAETEVNDYVVSLANTQDAAQKGEGIYAAVPQRGKGKQINGGGGGNRIEGGGGGGANAGSGGKGGNGKDYFCIFSFCSISPASSEPYASGIGGQNLNAEFTNDKIFLGGGGGGGQAQNSTLNQDVSEPGANGGGIVIIRAQNIAGNSFHIRSNGSEVPLANVFGGPGGDGQGGGGAGGSILLEVDNFSSATNVEARGSDGGDILSGDTAGRFRAPGGGGGGGLVWISGTTAPASVTNLSCDVSAGLSGISENQNGAESSVNGAENGSVGTILNNLLIPEPVLPLTGVYTIGGTSPDFATFAEAVEALNANGLGGNTTFRLRNGNYVEPSDNTHQINTLTYACNLTTAQLIIESESGNATDVAIQSNASGTSYALALVGLDNEVILRNLRLETTQAPIAIPNDFYDAVNLDNSSNVSFENVQINGSLFVQNNSLLTLNGDNQISNGHLRLQASVINQGTSLSIGLANGGNLRFENASAYLENVGTSPIDLYGQAWRASVDGASFVPNQSKVTFRSPSLVQSLAGRVGTNRFYELELDNINGLNMSANHTIDHRLTLSNGILNTNAQEIIFSNIYPLVNNPNETNTARIVGQARLQSQAVGTSALTFLGLVMAAGDDIGNLELLRTTGANGIVNLGLTNSIACTWDITSSIAPSTSGRQVSFYWLSVLDNGNDPNSSIIWRNPGAAWAEFAGPLASSNTNPRLSPGVNVTAFSEWTISSNPIPLPLENLVLVGEFQENGRHYLRWQGVQTTMPLYLEYSQNGQSFETLQTWQNPSSSVGEYQRAEVATPTYYRLRQELDNRLVISNIVYLKTESPRPSIYPNPTSGNIHFGLPQNQNTWLVCYDPQGRQIWQFVGKAQQAESLLEQQMQHWAEGVYLLKINGSTFKLIYRKE